MNYLIEVARNLARSDPDMSKALCELVAQQLATQALTIAFASVTKINRNEAIFLIEKVAGNLDLIVQKISDGSNVTIGNRALDTFMRLANMRAGFVAGK